jgi:hypothetical protein
VKPEVKLIHAISEVDRGDWDALVGSEGSPFLEWDWLAALEEAGCVSPRSGWGPHHVTVRDEGRLLAAAPMYVKGHSQGEFVFDHSWAEAAHSAGISYYPKLLAAVPFTPATGRRLLTHPDLPRAPLLEILAGALAEICRANEISSLHVNFCDADEVEPLRNAGFLHRQGVQYHWLNRNYARFEDYLGDLRSKRRNQIRRERRDIAASGIEVSVHEGETIADGLFEPMFRIYRSTIEKMHWGHQYLNQTFFDLLRQRWKRNLCFIVARQEGEIVAGTVNVQKAGAFYGRYWGAFREIRNLHFEVCYYAGIEHCIDRGLQRFEPGAGGEFKYWRGFEPSITHSMHYLSHPGFAEAVDRFLDRERQYVGEAVTDMRNRQKNGL